MYHSITTAVVKPNLFEQIINNSIPSGIVVASAIIYKKSNILIAAAMRATEEAIEYLDNLSDYRVNLYYNFFTDLEEYMTKGNFVNVKLQYPSYTLISNGVGFEEGLPKIIAYQTSAGNWITLT